jgi:hypothetical protein
MITLPTRLRFSSAPIFAALLIALAHPSASAQEDNKPPKGFQALFNGHDFDNLVGGLGDVDWRKVEAMSQDERASRQKRLDEGARKHWKVEDGVLISDGDPNFFLSTPRDYCDFEMWVDWKINKNGDSGIYLRGVPQVQIWDPADPNQQKNGCNKGSGGLWNNKVHERWPKVVADNPVGEWNRMFIRMVGPYVTVKLNDKLVTDNVPLENYFDAKTQVPLRGPIYLQTHTTKLFFRNIFVREIKPKEADKILDKIGDKSADFKPIFNGKDLAGWTGATKAYEVVDGTLISKEGQHGNMFTDDTYDNFAVRVEFKLPPGGNNGLGLRSPITDKEVAYVGMESQILDDGDKKYAGWLHPYQTHGSLYGLAPAVRGYLRPVGQWNYEELTINGNKLTVDLNGFEILNTDIAKVREKPMDGKNHPGAFRTDGHFGLLGHNDPVAFRNLRIKRLTSN